MREMRGFGGGNWDESVIDAYVEFSSDEEEGGPSRFDGRA